MAELATIDALMRIRNTKNTVTTEGSVMANKKPCNCLLQSSS